MVDEIRRFGSLVPGEALIFCNRQHDSRFAALRYGLWGSFDSRRNDGAEAILGILQRPKMSDHQLILARLSGWDIDVGYILVKDRGAV